jgi:hypothetical protein
MSQVFHAMPLTDVQHLSGQRVGHGVALAAQFEPEETAVVRQRLVDIADLQRDVVEANYARSPTQPLGPPLPV